MKRYFDLTNKTDNNFCDVIDVTFMTEIPNNNKPYGLIDGQVIDISETEAYKTKILKEEKEIRLQDLQLKIAELEKSQLRAVREFILYSGNEFAKTKLQGIEIQIQGLREQIGTL